MTLKEAYIIAKKEREKIGLTRLLSCKDYGAFWGFMFVYPDKKPDGLVDVTIHKTTGEVSNFNPIMDINLFNNAKPIPIEQFAEYSVAV